jgi:plasmid stabilization system protein ParE
MRYRLVLQRLAREDLYQAYEWAAANAPGTAIAWLKRFQDSLESLDHNPERCPLAHESGKVAVDVREFLFGKRPSVFRVLFIIDGEIVRILRIRRAQRRFLTKSEMNDALKSDEDRAG